MRIAIVTFALLILACSKNEAAPEPAAETEAAEAAQAEAAPNPKTDLENLDAEVPEVLQGDTPKVGAPPSIDVVEPGADPKTALRFDIGSDVSEKASMDLGFMVEAVVAVMHVRNPEYIVSYDVSMRAKKAGPDGLRKVSFTVDAANIDFKLIGKTKRAKLLKAALEGARKVKGSYTLSPRGHVRDLKVEVPKGAVQEGHDMADNLALALLQSTPVLPEAPIGAGAKWTVHEGIMQGGIHVNQLRTFELVSAKDGSAEIKVDIRQRAAKQPFENPGKPMPLQLQVLDGTGAGTVTWDLTKLTPRKAELQSQTLKGVTQEITSGGAKRKADSAVQSKRRVMIGGGEAK